MKDEQLNYSWESVGFGGTLTQLSTGKSCWFQGDDHDSFDYDWNCAQNNWALNRISEVYF